MVAIWVSIVVGLVALIVGWVIGFFDSNARTSKKIEAAETQAQIKIEEARKQIEEAEKNPAKNNFLCLWADEAKNLNVELDGARIESPQSATPEQRRRLVTLLAQIRPWVEGGPVAPAPKPAERSTTPLPAAAQPRPVTPAAAKPAAEPPPAPVVKSIVAQINDVLQARLAGTPLAAKRIRLGETPSGGVLVHVGSNRYEGIDAVPDPEVVAAIRAAIAEWEKGSH